MIESVAVIRIKGDSRQAIEDIVAEEIPLTLVIDGQELATILCSPADLDELAIGFLFTSGLIKKAQEIKKIVVDKRQWIAHLDLANPPAGKDLIFKRLYTSGCGRGTLFYNVQDLSSRSKTGSNFKLAAEKIHSLLVDFQKKSEIYFKTGGAHSAALADEEMVLFFREDIGRHNALDKIIGAALKENISFTDKLIITSGRISSEVLLKAQKCLIPIIVSKSAPTNQAIKLARDMEITLAGFARGDRMNVYSETQRIT